MAHEAGAVVPKDPSGDMKYLADHVGGVHCGENQMNSSANNVRSQGDTALIHKFSCPLLLVIANCREKQTAAETGKGSTLHSCLPISSLWEYFGGANTEGIIKAEPILKDQKKKSESFHFRFTKIGQHTNPWLFIAY